MLLHLYHIDALKCHEIILIIAYRLSIQFRENITQFLKY